ncbi:MAG: hypothetical protein JWQ71_251 [Pedosphaera sp.]|nr:hypothetical protein [Pedosphaera sp.]
MKYLTGFIPRVLSLACCYLYLPALFAQTPVVVQTNATIRVMAANLSSGNYQRYETAGLDILKGLKPDVVCIQEFNYLGTDGTSLNTPTAIREMINNTFGTNFVYFRESGYNIPNGVISRYPMLASGSWVSDVGDRGYAWAQLDIPGTNHLYVVSVHLKASSSSASMRANEAVTVKSNILANFPANAWVVLGGDLNISSSGEAALATMKTYLSDTPIPTDAESGGDADTNAGRSSRYDYVFPSFNLSSNEIPAKVGSHTFSNGVVFDSRVYTPLSDVSPVQSGDSGVTGMQHMGVIKDFNIAYSITNFVTNVVVTAPLLVLQSSNVIRWQGVSNVTYTVQVRTNLNFTNWITIGTASSTTTNISFTNNSSGPQKFFRVTYP